MLHAAFRGAPQAQHRCAQRAVFRHQLFDLEPLPLTLPGVDARGHGAGCGIHGTGVALAAGGVRGARWRGNPQKIREVRGHGSEVAIKPDRLSA